VKVILGIGNPGNRYQLNRHNVGFMFLDYFASSYSVTFNSSKFDYYFSEGEIDGNRFSLIRPTTYVNNSGIAAQQAIQNYKIEIADFLVVYDDINLAFPDLRLRASGGDGGHNGINSVIYHLASEDFPRLRVGIGNNFDKGKMAEYVLSDFTQNEFIYLEKSLKDVSILVKEFICGGLKNLFDSNSTFVKNNNEKKLLNQSKGNQENL